MSNVVELLQIANLSRQWPHLQALHDVAMDDLMKANAEAKNEQRRRLEARARADAEAKARAAARAEVDRPSLINEVGGEPGAVTPIERRE